LKQVSSLKNNLSGSWSNFHLFALQFPSVATFQYGCSTTRW